MVVCGLALGCTVPARSQPASQELADAARPTPRRVVAPRRDGSADSIVLVFPSRSSRLTPSATRRLDGLGLDADGTARVRVDGFAGGSGAPDANRDLAQRREEAVIEYLLMQGIRREQLSAATVPDEAALPNRAVRVTLLTPVQSPDPP